MKLGAVIKNVLIISTLCCMQCVHGRSILLEEDGAGVGSRRLYFDKNDKTVAKRLTKRSIDKKRRYRGSRQKKHKFSRRIRRHKRKKSQRASSNKKRRRRAKGNAERISKQTNLNQSPINLSQSFAMKTNLKDVSFNYDKTASLYLDKQAKLLRKQGRRVAMRCLGNNFILVDGKRYRLDYIDFKTPSEHVFDWKHRPAEMQFVHKGEDGTFVVLAVFLQRGKSRSKSKNHELGKLIRAMTGGTPRVDEVRLMNLIPEDRRFYRYQGSLTVKPFTENVIWFVFSSPLKISVEQLWDIEDTVGGRNNRQVQLPDDRTVYSDTSSDG